MRKTTILFFALCFSCYLKAQTIPCPDEKAPPLPDTTIVLANGTELTFNRCDFFEIRNCIETFEIRSLADAQRNGLYTQDNEGNVLLTCGMFILQLDPTGACGNLKCLPNPIRVRIPFIQNLCLSPLEGNNDLYEIGPAGQWVRKAGGKEVVSNNKQYLEFYTKCSGAFNCDKKLHTVGVKFKSKRLKEIDSMKVMANCPVLNLIFLPSKRKNIAFAKLPCINPESLHITVFGKKENGDADVVSKKLSEFTSKYTKVNCQPISRKVKRRILGIFPLRERYVYRKYVLK